MRDKRHIGVRGASALLAVGVMALVLVACGSSSSSSSSTSDGGTSSASGGGSSSASKSPYVIGSIVSETGPFGSSDAAGAQGVKDWANYVNSHGGINGHHVELTVKDDQGNPSVALSEVKAFAAQQNLIALVGNVSSEVASWAPVASKENLPVVGEFPFTPISFTTKYVFPQGTTYPSAQWGETYTAIKLAHLKKIAVLYCAEEAACADVVPANKQAATALGGQVVNSQAVSATAPNYDAVCQAAKSAGAQGVLVALGESTVVSVAESCSSIGYKPIYIAQSTALVPSQGSIAGLNNHFYGVMLTAPWTANSTPAQKTFQAATNAASISGSVDGPALGLGYTGGALFEAAMQNVSGTASRAAVANALWGLPKADTLGGLAPPLTYAANAPSPQQKCFFVMKLVNGKWSSPYGPTKTFCQP